METAEIFVVQSIKSGLYNQLCPCCTKTDRAYFLNDIIALNFNNIYKIFVANYEVFDRKI